jgi:hypothetical protein
MFLLSSVLMLLFQVQHVEHREEEDSQLLLRQHERGQLGMPPATATAVPATPTRAVPI